MKRTSLFPNAFRIGSILLILSGFVIHSISAEEKQNIRFVITSDGKLNVREKPKDGKVIFQLEKGESVTIKDGSQYEDWQEIVASSGKKGFVSAEFLAKKRPEELNEAKLFGSISSSTEGSWFRSLAIRIKNQWFAASEYSAEAYFLEKKAIQAKEKATAYEGVSIAGEFSPEKKEITGCQEVRVVKGNFNAFKKINTLENSVYAIFGSKIGDKVRSEKYKPTDKVSKLLDSSANAVFKKKHPNPTELKFLKRGDLYTIQSPGKNYIFVRYAVKLEVEEKSYYSAIFEFDNGEIGKKIFEKFDILMNEQAMYGGQYHFMDALDLDENGTPVIILHHNGYDGFINEFARIKNGQLQTMFLTGGDAC
ncbi:SH3 domain-containing protein [Leptospira barantonii]|uniref:SH3 domain-containing protein n=1 Tax=Leptospira barantonii TaxID=2023184 RepID=A0A5F2BNT3_9LEPT|nr:SH3 domain-containing protein [Leptospira barantonii]TGM07191.1 SH3 domain-containing protein [Leptospira barantonii]